MRLRLGAALTTLALGALSGLAAGTAAPARAVVQPVTVMAWNMCGSYRNSWNCAGFGTIDNKIAVLELMVADHNVQGMLLQEVCESDLTTIVARLGTGWHSTFRPFRWKDRAGGLTDASCYNDATDTRSIGTAIVARSVLTNATLYRTTSPSVGYQRPFHCATATALNLRLCTAHLPQQGEHPDHPTWEYVDDQLGEIKDIVAAIPNVAFGGDFNVEPPNALNNQRAWVWPSGLYAYAPTKPGYKECDGFSPRATHDNGKKIDYVFSSEAFRSCSVRASPYSDHHVVVYGLNVQ